MNSTRLPKRGAGLLVFLAILLCSIPTAFAQPPALTDLILITGQSNVRASGTVYNAQIDTPHPQVWAFTSAGIWEQADLHQAWDVNDWQPGNGSLTDSSRQPYNNFALHLGKAIVESDPSRIVGFVLASAPGKGIGHWDPDKPTALPAEDNFYTIVMDKAEQALAAQTGKTRFDAVIWHQGETDWLASGTSDEDATQTEREFPTYYADKLTTLINNFRSSPMIADDAIFICGETAKAPVNARLMALNYDPDFKTSCVPGSDLATKDGTHFNASGLRMLGHRYGERYANMVNAIEHPGKLLRDNNWEQIGLPANAADMTVDAVFHEKLPQDTYGIEWLVFRYDAAANQYRVVLQQDQMQQGAGYWVLQSTGVDRTLHMPYLSTTTPFQPSTACASGNGCFPIPLVGVRSPTWNMLSYPYAASGSFSSSRILEDGVCTTGCSIPEAGALNLIEQTVWSFEQNGYRAITGSDSFVPWTAFWMVGYDGLGAEGSALLLTTQP